MKKAFYELQKYNQNKQLFEQSIYVRKLMHKRVVFIKYRLLNTNMAVEFGKHCIDALYIKKNENKYQLLTSL